MAYRCLNIDKDKKILDGLEALVKRITYMGQTREEIKYTYIRSTQMLSA
jgi:hypothetical protein